MTRLLAVEVSRTTLLRLVRALPVPEVGTVAVLGVDDFAFRKGRGYGSIVVDMHTGRSVDLLPDRRSDSFADWGTRAWRGWTGSTRLDEGQLRWELRLSVVVTGAALPQPQ